MGGERAFKTEYFMYILYCDTIRTQILNWSNRFGGGTGHKTVVLGAVRFFDWVKPVATVPVRFQPGTGTEPQIWILC